MLLQFRVQARIGLLADPHMTVPHRIIKALQQEEHKEEILKDKFVEQGDRTGIHQGIIEEVRPSVTELHTSPAAQNFNIIIQQYSLRGCLF